jgi:hypothetical protein
MFGAYAKTRANTHSSSVGRNHKAQERCLFFRDQQKFMENLCRVSEELVSYPGMCLWSLAVPCCDAEYVYV